MTNVLLTPIFLSCRRGKINLKILFEQVSNRNSTQDHHGYLNAIVTAQRERYGFNYHPYILSTDCDGALENAGLLTWPAVPGKPITKIVYANCVLLILIDTVRKNNTLAVCQANFATLQKIQPTIIINCKPHVLRGGRGWSVSTQRGAQHTRYKDQFTRSLMHVLCYGTQHWDIIELMIQLGILLYIVSEDTIDCEPFTNGSGVRLESCRQRYVTK